MTNKVVYIDAMNMLKRAQWAYDGLKTSGGVPTDCIHGFLNMFLSLMGHVGEAQFIVVWDGTPPLKEKRRPSWRCGIAGPCGYKRPGSFDPAFLAQARVVHQFMALLGHREIGADGLEADDLIGICSAAVPCKMAYVYSNDHDMYQLCGPKLTWLKPKKDGGINDFASFHFLEEYQLGPGQWAGYKALAGDKSDCYKAIDGLGEKKALKYIKAGVDPSVARWDKLPPAVQKMNRELQLDWARVHICYKLACIPRKPNHGPLPPDLRKAAQGAIGACKGPVKNASLDSRLAGFKTLCERFELKRVLGHRTDYFEFQKAE